MHWRRIIGGAGRVLTAAGVLLLLFVAYQLWGTGLRTTQAQNRLEDDLRAALTATTTTAPPATPAPSDLPGPSAPVPALQPEQLPGAGEAPGRIEAPAIGMDWVFVQGVSVGDLKRGPGHYPQTPMPGQAGNATIADHRTTYRAPFNRIDELEPVEGANLLTLTSCHPKYSARQRIIAQAELAGDPLAAVVQRSSGAPTEETAGLDGPSLSGDPVGRRPAYAVAIVPFAVALFLFFEQIARFWPANY